METIYEIVKKIKAEPQKLRKKFHPDKWFELENKQLITVISESFIFLDEFIATLISENLKNNKKIAIVNLGQKGNLATFRNLISIFRNEMFYLSQEEIDLYLSSDEDQLAVEHPLPFKILLELPRTQKLISYLEEKNLSLIDNIKSIKHLYYELSQIKNLDLVIIDNLTYSLFSFIDTPDCDITKNLKNIAEKLSIPVILTSPAQDKYLTRMNKKIRINDAKVKNAEVYSDTIITLMTSSDDEDSLTIEANFSLKNDRDERIEFRKEKPYRPCLLTIKCEEDYDSNNKYISTDRDINFGNFWEYFNEGFSYDERDKETKDIIDKSFGDMKIFIEQNPDYEFDYQKLELWVKSLTTEINKISRKNVLKKHLKSFDDKNLLKIFYLFLQNNTYGYKIIESDKEIINEIEEINNPREQVQIYDWPIIKE